MLSNLLPRVPPFYIEAKSRLKNCITTVHLLQFKTNFFIHLCFWQRNLCKLKNIHLGKPPLISIYIYIYIYMYICLLSPTFIYTCLHSWRLVYNCLHSSSNSSTLIYICLHSSSDSSVFLDHILFSVAGKRLRQSK